MPKTGVPYPAEFREQVVALFRAGRTVAELAREFEPSPQTIRDSVKEAGLTDAQTGLVQAAPQEERTEPMRLRRENQELRLERDILAKAAVWFARETESVPPRSRGS